jgi:Uma2 family endonuclease
MIQRVMTAEEFARDRAELPDAGQWSELVRGVPVSLSPPDVDHGTVILNLSKALAGYVHETLNGYPCFDLGLKVESRPDTVLFPAVSYFLQGDRFAEADKAYSDSVPALVVELLSTGERRRTLTERVSAYLRHGIRSLWLIDPSPRTVHIVMPGQAVPHRLSEAETLRGDPVLSGFHMRVRDLFTLPDWAM